MRPPDAGHRDAFSALPALLPLVHVWSPGRVSSTRAPARTCLQRRRTATLRGCGSCWRPRTPDRPLPTSTGQTRRVSVSQNQAIEPPEQPPHALNASWRSRAFAGPPRADVFWPLIPPCRRSLRTASQHWRAHAAPTAPPRRAAAPLSPPPHLAPRSAHLLKT